MHEKITSNKEMPRARVPIGELTQKANRRIIFNTIFCIFIMLNYLMVATSPAGINFPDFKNLVPITPDNTNDVAAKIIKKSLLLLNMRLH